MSRCHVGHRMRGVLSKGERETREEGEEKERKELRKARKKVVVSSWLSFHIMFLSPISSFWFRTLSSFTSFLLRTTRMNGPVLGHTLSLCDFGYEVKRERNVRSRNSQSVPRETSHS